MAASTFAASALRLNQAMKSPLSATTDLHPSILNTLKTLAFNTTFVGFEALLFPAGGLDCLLARFSLSEIGSSRVRISRRGGVERRYLTVEFRNHRCFATAFDELVDAGES